LSIFQHVRIPFSMLDMSSQSRRHPLSERGFDLYSTPTVAVEALLRVEKIPHMVWECAAGKGAIVDVLRARGHTVVASDVVDYGGLHFVRDFLLEREAPAGIQCVLTNPPYRDGAAFVRHALKLCPTVIFLLRLAFIESVSRTDILDGGKLARIYPFRNRLPFMHRDNWAGARASSAIPFAWFVWSRDHVGPATIRRISWER
jgi:hypothetical protein